MTAEGKRTSTARVVAIVGAAVVLVLVVFGLLVLHQLRANAAEDKQQRLEQECSKWSGADYFACMNDPLDD